MRLVTGQLAQVQRAANGSSLAGSDCELLCSSGVKDLGGLYQLSFCVENFEDGFPPFLNKIPWYFRVHAIPRF